MRELERGSAAQCLPCREHDMKRTLASYLGQQTTATSIASSRNKAAPRRGRGRKLIPTNNARRLLDFFPLE